MKNALRSTIAALTTAATLAAVLPPAPVAADDPFWSSPLALGPTNATTIAAREGLVLAGGTLHYIDMTEEAIPGPRTSGLFRSADEGRSWTLGAEPVVVDGQATLRPITETPDLVGAPPTGPDAYALFGTAVWRSEDDGVTWLRVGTAPAGVTTLDFLADGRAVAGLSTGGLRVSADRGATWVPLGSGLPASRVNEVLPYSATLVLVATATGLYRSADGGQTFAQATTGIDQPSASALGVAGDGTSPLYLAMPGRVLTSTAVYLSTDQGSTWQPRVSPVGQSLLPRVNNGAFDVVVQGSLYLLYAGTTSGLYRSGTRTQAGLEWERLEPEPGGLAVTELAGADSNPGPLRDFTVYAALRRSSPAAVTRNAVRLTAPGWIDELEGGRICGGLVSRPDGALFAACGRHVFRSNDHGATWSGAGNGLPYVSAGVGDTPFNPLVASADGSLWTSGFHYGLYHSNAAVTQWSKVAFPGASVGAIGTHPTDANIVYAAGLLTNGSTGLLYKSTDGGATWGRPILDLGTNVYTISVSPSTPSKVLVAAYDDGLWISEDGGGAWTQALGISGNVYRAYYTAASPARAWALTSDGFFRSDDAGRTWELVGQVVVDGREKSTFEIQVSPWDADTIYSLSIDGDLVVTQDGGVTWDLYDGGLPKHPDCNICEEISHLVPSRSTEGEVFIAAGVLGYSVAPQSMWIYRGMTG